MLDTSYWAMVYICILLAAGVLLKYGAWIHRERELNKYDIEELKQRHEDYRTKLRLEQQSKIDAIWVNNDR